MTSEELAREIAKVNARLGAMEREVSTLTREHSEPGAEPSRDAGPVNHDARWHCKKCGYLLGFYDIEEDILRTRYKEHIVFVRVGNGGFVQVVCRGCSEVNTANGDEGPGSEVEEEAGGESAAGALG